MADEGDSFLIRVKEGKIIDILLDQKASSRRFALQLPVFENNGPATRPIELVDQRGDAYLFPLNSDVEFSYSACKARSGISRWNSSGPKSTFNHPIPYHLSSGFVRLAKKRNRIKIDL